MQPQDASQSGQSGVEPSNTLQQPTLPPQPAVIGGDTQQQPQPQPQPQPVIGQPVMQAKPKKKFLKILVVALVALLLIGGGGAAAYMGIIVPNKPENVLRQSFINLLEADATTIDGSMNIKTEEVALAMNMKIAGTRSKKTSQGTMDITVSGIKVPVEMRLIDKSMYIKLGDLSSLKAAAKMQVPSAAKQIDQIEKKLSNQWIEIDSTLMAQAGMDCVIDASYAGLSDAEFDSLAKAFDKNPFVQIASTTDDTVNGKAATKYELKVDNAKADAFATDIQDESIFKRLNDCSKDTAAEGVDIDDATDLSEDGDAPFYVWVEKDSKRLVKIELAATEQDKKDGTDGSITMNISYEAADVQKPESSKSAMVFVSELQEMYLDMLSSEMLEDDTSLSPLLQMSEMLDL